MRSLARGHVGLRTAALTSLSLPALVALAVACNGGSPAEAKAPAAATGAATSAAGPSGSPPDGAATGGGGSGGTTTDALPPRGELQGARLTTATRTEVESKGDAGPKAGPGHTSEPGRRREDIQTIVMARRDDARACYDKGQKDHPGIEGDLTVKFVVDPQGAVTDASVDDSKSTIHEPSVGACVVSVIKRIKFAGSAGGFETRASYPFNFHPKTFGKADAGAP
jgi:TonB family protein